MTEQDILTRIETMQQQIEQQQQAIQALKGQLQQQQEETQASLAQMNQGSGLILGGNVDNLKFTGDLRIRNQYDVYEPDGMYDDDDMTADRWRYRLRLGFVWTNSTENFEIGAGIATGGAGKTSNSTNATWNDSEEFEYDSLCLDYAYAKHTWGDFSVTAGQQINPYQSTFILWDGDLRPAGFTAAYEMGGMFATGGYYVAFQDPDGDWGYQRDAAEVLAAQVGYSLELEGMDAMIAAAYYHFDDQYSMRVVGADPEDLTYELADIMMSVSGKAGDVALKLYGEAIMNLGAEESVMDDDEKDMAWVLGIEAKFAGLKLGYAYGLREYQSVPMALVDQDFAMAGDTTNVEGHRICAGYDISKNCALGMQVFMTECEESDYDDEWQTWQFDLKYKF
jgi:hypothetical protein